MEAIQFIMTLAMLACVLGCALLYKKKPLVSWGLGVAVIALGGLSFAFQVIAFAFTKEGAERLVLVITALLATPRQRQNHFLGNVNYTSLCL